MNTTLKNANGIPAEAETLNTQAIAALAREAVRPEIFKMEDGVTRVVWPDKTIRELESANKTPRAQRGQAQLGDADSFAAYVNRYKVPGTLLTGDANEQGGSFRALIDYHPATVGSEVLAAWTEHTAELKLLATPEWARWLALSGKDLDQRTFAEFLEDNAPDVAVPEGEAGKGFPTQQELLSVAGTLQIKTDVKFASSLRLQNGQVQLGYVETIDGGHGQDGSLKIPERFGLALAPFRGTPKYLVTARLRYRGTGGKALFRIELERTHKIVESAFADVRKKLHELTGLNPLLGSVAAQTR